MARRPDNFSDYSAAWSDPQEEVSLESGAFIGQTSRDIEMGSVREEQFFSPYPSPTPDQEQIIGEDGSSGDTQEPIDPASTTINSLVRLGLAKIISYKKAVATHAGSFVLGSAVGAVITGIAWSKSTSDSGKVNPVKLGIQVGTGVYRAVNDDLPGAVASFTDVFRTSEEVSSNRDSTESDSISRDDLYPNP